MINPLTSEIAGLKGSYEIFQALNEKPDHLNYDDVFNIAKNAGAKCPDVIIDSLQTAGLITQYEGILSLSTSGKKTLLLLDAINGADLLTVFRHLSYLYPLLRPYELVTEGMTYQFVYSLYERPDFGHIYICSPWISMHKKTKRRFIEALYKAERDLTGQVEIIIITLPESDYTKRNVPLDSLRWLSSIGAEVVPIKRLHAKLYIRTPGIKGGISMAIFGSENLTKRKWIELGIKIINDSELIEKLIAYYFDLYNQSIS